jgi:hypothetical protein
MGHNSSTMSGAVVFLMTGALRRSRSPTEAEGVSSPDLLSRCLTPRGGFLRTHDMLLKLNVCAGSFLVHLTLLS